MKIEKVFKIKCQLYLISKQKGGFASSNISIKLLSIKIIIPTNYYFQMKMLQLFLKQKQKSITVNWQIKRAFQSYKVFNFIINN